MMNPIYKKLSIAFLSSLMLSLGTGIQAQDRDNQKILAQNASGGLNIDSQMRMDPGSTGSLSLSSNSQVLQELEQRLIRQHPCVAQNSCAFWQKAEVRGTEGRLVLTLSSYAKTASFITLPSIVGGQWRIADPLFIRQIDQSLVLNVPKGSFEITLPIEVVDREIKISFPNYSNPIGSGPPKEFRFSGGGDWVLGNEGVLNSGNNELIWLKNAKLTAPETKEESQNPISVFTPASAWQVARQISVEPSQITSTITVSRMGSSLTPNKITLKLSPGERVVSGTAEGSKAGEVELDFTQGERTKVIMTRADKVEQFTLESAMGGLIKESWELNVSNKMRPKFEGLEPISTSADGTSSFLPFSGQKLKVSLMTPKVAEGKTFSFDNIAFNTTIAEGFRIENLETTVRSSIAQTINLTVDSKWKLVELNVNGRKVPFEFKEGVLKADVPAGTSKIQARFENTSFSNWIQSAPSVKIETKGANLTWGLQMPQNIWFLYAIGEGMAPVVLIWGWFIVVAAAAWGLGKFAKSPGQPSFLGWMGILLPLTALDLSVVFVVIGFSMLIEFKHRYFNTAISWSRVKWNSLQFTLMLLAAISFLSICSGIYAGLLGVPDMMVAGPNQFASNLQFYLDYPSSATGNQFIEAHAITAPMWLWRVLMLVWALWIAKAIVGRAPGIWVAMHRGDLWRASAKDSDSAITTVSQDTTNTEPTESSNGQGHEVESSSDTKTDSIDPESTGVILGDMSQTKK